MWLLKRLVPYKELTVNGGWGMDGPFIFNAVITDKLLMF